MNDISFEFPFIMHNLSRIKEKILIAVKTRIENTNKSRGIKVFIAKSNDRNFFNNCLDIYFGKHRYTLYMHFKNSNISDSIFFELYPGGVGELKPDFHYKLYLDDINSLFYRSLILLNMDLQNDRRVYPTLGNSQDDRLLTYFDKEGNLIPYKIREEMSVSKSIVYARPMSDSIGFGTALSSSISN